MALDGAPPGPRAGTSNLTSESSGGRHIGEYSVQRELGRGGMGAVYLAEHDVTHEQVAIKELLITAAADPIAVQRFLQEGAVMSRLTHPNIVGVRGIIEAGLGHYIALEFIEGGTLRDLLKGGPLPIPQAFAVMHGLLKALDYAHQHAIVHRDVKPENVMLSGMGEVKVADFGIARLTDEGATSNATRTGTTVGTPQYMSPEQVTTSKVDARSDLYSAGIVCYEVFCGRPPFEASEADGPFTLFAKHVQAPPPPPTVIHPGLDPALEAVILKSLSKRPEDRYQTGAEFDRELSAIATRLYGPNWVHSLERGTDLATMVPAPIAARMALPDRPAAPPAYAPATPRQKREAMEAGGPNLLMFGAVAGAVLVVAVVVAIIAFSQKPSTGVTSGISTGFTPSAGPCDFLRAGVTPAGGAGGTCALRLGSQVHAYSFAQSAMPADLSGIGIDGDGAPKGKAAIPVGGGFAALSASSRGAGVGIQSGTQPADLIVIADFTPTTSGDANIGIGARCSATDCIEVYVSPKGRVWVTQRSGGGAPVQKFNSEAPVQVNQLNRLVVAVKGSQVQSWINGSLISSVQVDVNSAGAIVFFDSDQDTTHSATNLSALYVFAPG
ncbi:MAG: serine/threonine protein kinase [Candidatus Dormibacteraeota bacterium]|nr:serine/threonine protein kinase [Candidatus Dormibacteraeota bacterium]